MLLSACNLYAASYKSYNAGFTIDAIKDLIIPNTTNVRADAIVSVNYTIRCNYDNWHVGIWGMKNVNGVDVESPGLYNASRNHTIPLYVASVAHGSTPAARVYKSLGSSSELVPLDLQTGNFAAGAQSFDLYLKPSQAELDSRRYGYYNIYLMIKITDNI